MIVTLAVEIKSSSVWVIIGAVSTILCSLAIMIKEFLPLQQMLVLVLFENLMIPTKFLTGLTSMLYLDSDKKSYCSPKP